MPLPHATSQPQHKNIMAYIAEKLAKETIWSKDILDYLKDF